jgi:hypothetical protein
VGGAIIAVPVLKAAAIVIGITMNMSDGLVCLAEL